MMRGLTRCLAWVARGLPGRWVGLLGTLLGWSWHSLVPIRRALVRQKIQSSLGTTDAETKTMTRAVYQHLGISVAELFRFGTRAGLSPTLRVEGEAHLLAAIEEGKGVLALTAHLGNWEVLARYGSTLPVPLSIVTRRLSLGGVQAMWETLREGGPQLIPAQGASRPLVEALGRGEIVGFVLDQHAPESSAVVTEFLGRPAATSTGLVRAARLTGAPIVPLFSWRDGDEHVISIGAPLSLPTSCSRGGFIRQVTARCTQLIEHAVRQHPEQWLWVHRRWKVDDAGINAPAPPDVDPTLVAETGRTSTTPLARSSVQGILPADSGYTSEYDS
jgi:Kdo2-lipid IVA lauroyltransferase/acyltransferase